MLRNPKLTYAAQVPSELSHKPASRPQGGFSSPHNRWWIPLTPMKRHIGENRLNGFNIESKGNNGNAYRQMFQTDPRAPLGTQVPVYHNKRAFSLRFLWPSPAAAHVSPPPQVTGVRLAIFVLASTPTTTPFSPTASCSRNVNSPVPQPISNILSPG